MNTSGLDELIKDAPLQALYLIYHSWICEGQSTIDQDAERGLRSDLLTPYHQVTG